jgi:transposase InsO family protein
MKHVFIVFTYLVSLIHKFLKHDGLKAVIAENLLLKQQLLVLTRSRKRAPNLSLVDRFFLGLWSTFLAPRRIRRVAVLVQPSTLLKFHQALVKRKYHFLYSSPNRKKPGPKGPSQELIMLVLEMKRRNPNFGCTKIAEQLSKTFALPLDKDVVRRILITYFRPERDGGPSWLSFLGQTKDSLWSIDFFRCESLRLKTHWVLVVMDQCTRRIIGFGVHPAPAIDGKALCRLFHQATSPIGSPHCLSSDHDPVFRFHQWQANLRILGIHEIKTIPGVPVSHPFIERLIGTIRREYLDHLLFWNESDLERKLDAFKDYYNGSRIHQSLNQQTPEEAAGKDPPLPADPTHFVWRSHCQGLFQTPIAA